MLFHYSLLVSLAAEESNCWHSALLIKGPHTPSSVILPAELMKD